MSTPTPSAPPSGPPAGPPPRADERRQEQREPQREERQQDQPERRQEQRPPWEREGGEPFDPERAWTQMQALRSERDRARTERDDFRGRVEEHDRSQMNETQRMEADRDGQRQRADTAEAQVVALRAALQHGIPAADLEEFVDLLGTGSAEQLASRAERLAPRFAATPSAPPRNTPPPSTRPTEAHRPRGGGDPTQEPDETDLDKIGERLMSRR